MSLLKQKQLEQRRKDLDHELTLYEAVREEIRLNGDVVQRKTLEARAQQLEGKIQTIEAEIRQLEAELIDPPLSGAGHLQRGETRLRNDDFAGAVRDFKAAIAVDPLNPIAHNNLAATYRMMGDYPAAIEMATKTIHLKPTLPEPWATRGAAYLALHDARAIADLEQALAINPQYEFALNKLAEARRKFR